MSAVPSNQQSQNRWFHSHMLRNRYPARLKGLCRGQPPLDFTQMSWRRYTALHSRLVQRHENAVSVVVLG